MSEARTGRDPPPPTSRRYCCQRRRHVRPPWLLVWPDDGGVILHARHLSRPLARWCSPLDALGRKGNPTKEHRRCQFRGGRLLLLESRVDYTHSFSSAAPTSVQQAARTQQHCTHEACITCDSGPWRTSPGIGRSATAAGVVSERMDGTGIGDGGRRASSRVVGWWLLSCRAPLSIYLATQAIFHLCPRISRFTLDSVCLPRGGQREGPRCRCAVSKSCAGLPLGATCNRHGYPSIQR